MLDLTGHSRTCPLKIHGEACAAETLRVSHERIAALARRVDAIGFYSMAALHFFVSTFHAAAKTANPAVKTILGGPHASTAPDRCAAEGWDYVVCADQGGGGGEPGFLEALQRAGAATNGGAQPRGSRPPSGFKSLSVLLPSLSLSSGGCGSAPTTPTPPAGHLSQGEIIRVPSRDPSYIDVGESARNGDREQHASRFDYSNDRFPFPARDLIDFDDYRYTLDGRRFASVVTQAGCVYRCSFCAHSEGYTKLVLRSPEHVRGELREILERYPWVGGVMLYDDEVNIRGDLHDLLDMLGEEHRRAGLVFRGFFKSGKKYMTRDLFARFHAAGFRYLCTGAESGHPEVLRRVGKGATLEDNTDFVRLCMETGIKAKVFTQVGLPGETDETAEATARWLESMASTYGLSDFDTSITTPTSGTPLFEQPEKFASLIRFDKAELESNVKACNYKGIPGQYQSFVETIGWDGSKGLSRSEIVAWRQRVEDRGRKAAGLAPLVAKDDG